MNKGYEDLKVWHKAITLADEIYQMTQSFPTEEKYGLQSQIRRCAVSVPSNIAEGCARNSYKEFARFLGISTGSLAELHTQLIIANHQNYITQQQFEETLGNIKEVRRMLSGLKNSLRQSSHTLVTDNS